MSPALSGGGAERFASNLLCFLDRSRFEPQLCLVGEAPGSSLTPNIPVSSLGKTRPWHIPRAIHRLRRHLEVLQPDVLIGTMFYTNWLIGAALGGTRRPRPFWIARFAISPIWEYGPRGPYGLAGPILRPIFSRLVKRADRWVANSEGLAGDVRKFVPAKADSVTVLRNPFDFDRLEKLADEPGETPDSNQAPVIAFIGRLARQKRPDLLLHALARLVSRPQAQLWICGDGPMKAAMVDQMRELGLGTRVKMLGFQQNPYRILRKTDILVLCSEFEGLPNALIEAQGLGVPAVTTRCRFGPDEIVEDRVTGLLVPVGDADALAAAIDEMLEDPERRLAMGRAAAERARRLFGSAIVTTAWERLISEGTSRECAE